MWKNKTAFLEPMDYGPTPWDNPQDSLASEGYAATGHPVCPLDT